ncbi:hypothetical protein [Jannaschia seosinensis]|uniref:hypothetical protein n=1 Tax=Jannaschia seosinensis TaxID=313367 RepID=UPI001C92866F|nr:hypothetical protein [Jannaschia seosinensis]
MEVYVPIAEAGARRAVPDTVPDWAFLPVRDGTLQIAAAPFVPEEQANPLPSASSLIGNCVFRQTHLAMAVDGAEDVNVSVSWTATAAGAIALNFAAPYGALREALWSAEEAPTSERLLPTGRTDPGHLRELPARFGSGIARNASLQLTPTGGAWSLTLDGTMAQSIPAIHWTAIVGLPLIPAVPMLASGAETRPSDMRAVVPVELDGIIRLESDGSTALAKVANDPVKTPSVTWPWVEKADLPAWGVPSVNFVSPTAPGLDYAWAPGTRPGRDSFDVSLRFDLPILDELYAQPDPEAEAGTAADTPPPPAPVTGVLDLAQISLLWSQRAFALATTRTQGVRATAWAGHGVPVDGPIALAAPYSADATVTFVRDYAFPSGNLPLGGYSLTWDRVKPTPFSGETALLGPMGGEDEPLALGLTEEDGALHPKGGKDVATLKLAGFAPDAYLDKSLENDDPTSLSDTRGTAMARARTTKDGVSRPARFRDRDGNGKVRSKGRDLVTWNDAIVVKGLGSDALFWVRDLPHDEDGVFDGTKNPVEGRLGPDPTPFAARALQDALYEWRLFERRAEMESADFSIRHNGLTLTPLRLLHVGTKEICVLCRASLEGPLTDPETREAFGEETPYRIGPLVEIKFGRSGGKLALAKEARIRALESAGGLDLVLSDKDPERLEFPLVAALVLRLAGATSTVADPVGLRLAAQLGELSDDPVFRRIELSFSLFNYDVTLAMEVDGKAAHPTYQFTHPDARPADGVWIAAARLEQVGPGTSGWRLDVTLDARVEIGTQGADRPHVLDTTGGMIRWLGYEDTDPPEIRIDHARGAIWLYLEPGGLSTMASPIEGMMLTTVDEWRFSAGLVTGTVAGSAIPVWPLASGLVQARMAGEANGVQVALTSHTRWSGETRDSEVLLTREAVKDGALRFQKSGISWDPDGLSVKAPGNPAKAARVETRNVAPIRHDVSVSLRDSPIPVTALARDGATVRLTRSVALELQVRHRLLRDNTELAAWRSFDNVQLTSEQLWQQDWTGKAFGPRFEGGRTSYRGEIDKRPEYAGIGDRSLMLSGFDDPLLRTDGHDTRLILVGGGTCVFVHHKTTHAFGLPWAIGMDTGASDLPKSFCDLMVFGEGDAWRAPVDDATPFEIAADALPPLVQVPSSVLGKAELDALLATKPGIGGAADLVWPSLQAFVERDPADAKVGDVKTWPLFLPSLVALQQTLKYIDPDKRADWRILSVRHRANASAVALAFPHESIAAPPAALERATKLHLVALDKGRAPRFFALNVPPDIAEIDTAWDLLGPSRLADLAEAQITDAVAVGLALLGRKTGTGGEDGKEPDIRVRDVRPVPIDRADNPFGREQSQLFDAHQQVYPSPALGWPEAVDAQGAARFAMDGRVDAPVISSKAGLAGRVAVLSTGSAVATRADRARYLVTQARVVFHHGDEFDKVALRAPPARHLAVLSPRARTPIREAREEALQQAMAKSAEDGSTSTNSLLPATMGVIPAIYSRALIGERPGVHETFIDALLSDGNRSDLIDRGARGAGRSAVLSPVLARQLRTPRSPALPEDPNFDLTSRRRTYVSLFDRTAPGGLALPMAVRCAASSLWRLAETDRFILDLQTLSLDPGKVRNSQERGQLFQLRLTLSHAGKSPVMEALAQSGFLYRGTKEAPYHLRAWLSLGETRIDAFRLDWHEPVSQPSVGKVSRHELTLELAFAGRDLGPLLSALADPDPNTPATLQMSFADEQKAAPFDPTDGTALLAQGEVSALITGEPTALSFPIGRKPARRPTLDIERRSFLFADPAFDRALACPGSSSQVIRNDGGSLALVLTADRTQYALTQTLYFAYGSIEDGAFERKGIAASLKLALIPKRGDATPSAPVELQLAGKVALPLLGDAQPYGLPLGLLEPKTSTAPRPAPGDRLLIELTPNDGFNGGALRLELPLAERADDPRPAAVYSVIALGAKDADGQPVSRTLMHAAAPAPDRVQFQDLLSDLATGHIRKNAIFEWRTTDLTDTIDWPHYTLTKTDRSGGAQLPKYEDDLVSPPQKE